MYPHPVLLGLTLYDILLCVGIFLCFVVFGYLADKHGVRRRIQSFAIMCGAGAVVLGYCSAVLFQALYNIKSLGRFEINENTGATFYGGLIGGVAVFLVLYFGLGPLIFKDNSHARAFFAIADCAVPGIALAHSLGRVGCLSAGCCHGALTDAWYGIEMWGNMGFDRYVPVQLFEAIFLLLLAAFLFLRSYGRQGLCLPLYLSIYAVWRFVAEYMRADYRGDTFVEALSPSQLIAVMLFAVGIGLIFIERYLISRFSLDQDRDDAKTEANDEAVE